MKTAVELAMSCHNGSTLAKLTIAITFVMQLMIVFPLLLVVPFDFEAGVFAVSYRMEPSCHTGLTGTLANSFNVGGEIESEVNFFHFGK